MRVRILRMARIAGLLGLMVATTLGAALAGDVTEARLLNAASDAEAGNWLTHHRTYDARRYSPLAKINNGNVAGLKLAYGASIEACSEINIRITPA